MRVVLLDGPLEGAILQLKDGARTVSFPVRRGPQPSFAAYEDDATAASLCREMTYEIGVYHTRTGPLYVGSINGAWVPA